MHRLIRACCLTLTAALICSVPAAAGAAEAKPAPTSKEALRAAAGMSGVAEVQALAADDDVPGTEIYPEKRDFFRTDTLTDPTDLDDVYSIFLFAGEKLSLTLVGAEPSDFALYLYGPDTETVATPEGWVMGDDPVVGGSYPVTLEYTVPETGDYYIDVWTWNDGLGNSGGSGTYTLTGVITRAATDVTITTASRTTAQLQSVALKGYVDSSVDETVTGTAYVYLSFDGVDFMPMAAVDLVGGSFSLTTWPQFRKTYYNVVYPGDSVFCPSTETKAFGCYPKIGNPVAPTYMRKGIASTVYALLEPLHTSGSRPVRIYKYRYVSGSWKSYGYVNATARDLDDWTSKCSVSLKLPYTGKWRLRAYAPADSQHAAKWSSGYDTVTVR